MGPVRNRGLLVFYIVACLGLTLLIGGIAAKTFVVPLLRAEPLPVDIASGKGLLVVVGPFVGLLATVASVRALLDRQPVRRPLAMRPPAEQAQARQDRRHELLGYAVLAGGVILIGAVILLLRALL